eukprot:SAG22_NODE_4329_length_1301_cov_1.410150_1_plen_38_part_10
MARMHVRSDALVRYAVEILPADGSLMALTHCQLRLMPR